MLHLAKGDPWAWLPVNTQIRAHHSVARSDDAAYRQLRARVQFMFPK